MCWLMIEYTTNGSEVKIIWRPQNLCADIGFYKVHDRTKHPIGQKWTKCFELFLRNVETYIFAPEFNGIASKFFSLITKHRSLSGFE